MPKIETATRKILERLVAEGWIVEGGTKHMKLGHPAKPGLTIMVPRRRELEPGTARSIARAAGWS